MRHGLAGLLADALAEAAAPVPPTLAAAARAQLAAGLKHKRLTLTVVDALARAGVTPVLLKGYGLAARLFPEHPLARPSSDVDVLVLPEELPLVEPALAALGLTLTQDEGLHDVFEEHHHRAWQGPPGLVEVHFRLFSGFGGRGFDERGLQARTRLATLEGRPVRHLAPDDELLYLATHAANHAFLRLSWLVDLLRFVERHPALDWAAVAARARAAGFTAPLATALALTERLFDLQLPEAARRALPRPAWRRALDARLYSDARLVSAVWSQEKGPAILLRLYLVDTSGQAARELLSGARRWLRRRRSGG